MRTYKNIITGSIIFLTLISLLIFLNLNCCEEKNILITAFGAFGNVKTNPSLEATKDLHNKTVGEYTIRFVKLPVVYYESYDILKKAFKKYDPELVISFGVAPYDELRLEKIAHNGPFSKTPDNKGVIPNESLIIEGEGDFVSTLPLNKIYSKLNEHKYPVTYSESAGTYLCNYIFYNLMYEVNNKKKKIPAGFIHVPRLSDKFTLKMLKSAVNLIIETSVEFYSDKRKISFVLSNNK